MRFDYAAILLTLVLGYAPALNATDYSPRKWTNDQGETIEATLRRVSGKTAVLDHNGEIVRAPINRLSEADQEWLESVRELKRWREWTMADGSTQRAKLEELDGEQLTLKSPSEEFELTLDQVSDADRELISAVYNPSAMEESNASGLSSGEVVTRNFTDNRGKTINAEYRGVEGDKIVLFFKDREWRVPLADFSAADQQWVAQAQLDGDLSSSSAIASNGQRSQTPQLGLNRDEYNRTRNAIDGRMGVGSNPASRMHEEMMARMETQRQQMEQDRLKRNREREERLAQMRREADERRAEREREREEQFASAAPPPSSRPKAPIASEPNTSRPDTPAPNFREPTYPTSSSSPSTGPADGAVWVNQYECFSCNHKWESTRKYGAGDKCPSCGVSFDYMEDENGQIVEETSSSKARRYGGIVKLVIFAVIAVGGLLSRLGR